MAIVQDPTHPTGVSLSPGDKGGSRVRNARTRKALAAVQLRVEGYTMEDIAVALGFPSGREVGVAIETAMNAELRETDKAALRNIAGRRLEQAWRSLSDKIQDPKHPEHLAAINSGVKVIDRHSKLMGLDAPTEFIVSTPAAEELQAYVDQVVALNSGHKEIVEADVLDADSHWEGDDLDANEEDDLVEEPDPSAVPTQ